MSQMLYISGYQHNQQEYLIVRRALCGKYETQLADGHIWGKIEFASFHSSCPFLVRAFHFQILYPSSSLRDLNSSSISESLGELGKQLIFKLNHRAVRSET